MQVVGEVDDFGRRVVDILRGNDRHVIVAQLGMVQEDPDELGDAAYDTERTF